MAVRLLSDDNLEQLRNNQYVLSATSKRIIYTESFKQYFVKQYQQGLGPKEIFKRAGFDVDALGYKRIERASERWLTAGGITLHRNEPKEKQRLEIKIAKQQAEIDRLNSELKLMKSQARV